MLCTAENGLRIKINQWVNERWIQDHLIRDLKKMMVAKAVLIAFSIFHLFGLEKVLNIYVRQEEQKIKFQVNEKN